MLCQQCGSTLSKVSSLLRARVLLTHALPASSVPKRQILFEESRSFILLASPVENLTHLTAPGA